MSDHSSESLDQPERLPPARRRRARRQLTQLQADEREVYLEELAKLVSPDLFFFLYALLAGALIGLGFRFDQIALLVAGALIAPTLGPVVGMALATISGSFQVFLRLLGAMAVAALIIALAAGLIGGLGVDPNEMGLLVLAYTNFDLVDFGVLLAGAILLAYFLATQERLSTLASTAVAYEIFVPLGAFAVGVILGRPDIWQDAGLLFLFHLTWAVVAGVIVLVLLGFRPLTGSGHSLIAAVILIAALTLLSVFSLGASVVASIPTPTPTPTSTGTPTLTPTSTSTATPSATATATPTSTDTPTATATATPTPPTAVIYRTGGQGAILRDQPAGDPIGYMAEGELVLLLGPAESAGGFVWLPVRTQDGLEGWVLDELLATITPSPTVTPE